MREGRRAVLIAICVLCAIAGCTTGRRSTGPLAAPLPESGIDSARTAGAEPAVPLREIAILYTNASGNSAIAAQLRKLLPASAYRVAMADIEAAESAAMLQAMGTKSTVTAVAIGLQAARLARDHFKGPVVFAQVFNHQELVVGGRTIRGVAALPPLDLQLQEWRKVDPQLQRVGLILSESHAALVAHAEKAARSAGVALRREVSDSDRETLYLFKRLAPQIDGLWLLPDDRILSPTIVRELLSYAASHGVRVCVFTDTLFSWGAFMSATPTPGDVARTVRRVLDGMAGTSQGEPALAPLSEVAINVNAEVAARMRMFLPSLSFSWIGRR